MLQRITRSIGMTSRTFSTSSMAMNEAAATTTPTKPTGLYQFFQNNEALPKQIWTGNKI
jgi:large subunit ribosomal protein L47